MLTYMTVLRSYSQRLNFRLHGTADIQCVLKILIKTNRYNASCKIIMATKHYVEKSLYENKAIWYKNVLWLLLASATRYCFKLNFTN